MAKSDTGHWLRDLLLLLLMVGVLFGYELGSRALWNPDEGRYAEIPREMAESGDYVTPRLNYVKYFEKPVLFYWLQTISIRLFGLSETSLRLWTAVFAALGCLAVYFAGRRLYHRRVGWLAAAVLATTPLYDFMGGIITLDMAVSAFITIGLLSFLIGVREPPGPARRWWLWAFYVSTALATMTKGLIGIVIPGMVIGAWIILLGEWRLLRTIYLPSGTILFFAIAAPWHVLAARANPEFLQFYFVHEHFARYFTTVHQRYAPVWYFIPVLLAGMYPWSAFFPPAIASAVRGLWRERRQHRETWFLLLWAGLVFVFYSLSKSKLSPYILPVLPPLALLCGRYFANVWERPELFGRGRVFWFLFLLSVILGMGILAAPYVAPSQSRVVMIAAELGTNLYFMAAGLILAGVVPFALNRLGYARHTIVALIVTSALALTLFDVSSPLLDASRSVKPLALTIKQRLKPGDEVVSYHDYYQDLPFYLERRVTVVGTKGELEFGTEVEDTSAWMIDDAAFAEKLASGAVAYIVTNKRNVETLRAAVPKRLHLLAQYGDYVMLTNREQKL